MKSRDPRCTDPANPPAFGVDDEVALGFAQFILPADEDDGLVNPEFLVRTEEWLLSRGETERPEAEAWYGAFLGWTDEQLETVGVALLFSFRRYFRAVMFHPDYEVALQMLPLLQGLMYLTARGLVLLRGEDPRQAVFRLPPRVAPSEAMDRAIVARIDGLLTEERIARMLDRVCRVPPMESDGEG